MKMPKPAVLTIFIGLFLSAVAPLTCGAKVTARLDRQEISINETVTLSVKADGARNTIADLDASALEKDFSILNRSSSSNFQLVNGTTHASKTWRFELEAKRTGTFKIPPFTVGKERSNPLTLKVTEEVPLPTSGGKNLRDVILEVTPEIDTPAYLQEQITISVKLYINSRLSITGASLEDPKLEHAIMQKLGGDRNYQIKKGDIEYQVIERKYAIIAEEGDKVVIPPLHFQAVSLGNNRGPFGQDPLFARFSRQTTRRLRAHSQELTIKLTPIPKTFNGEIWLPARKMKIMENQDKIKEIKVGEPLTRIIQIEALGLTAEQLPDLTVTAPDGGKIYLDKPELKTNVDNNSILHAVKRQSLAFIPEKAGTYTLSAIKIKWWDVVNNRQSQISLPERTIKVVNPGLDKAAAATGTNPEPGSQLNKTATDKTAGDRSLTPPDEKLKPVSRQPESHVKIWQMVCLLLLLLWILTLFLWRRALRQRAANSKPAVKMPARPAARTLENVKKACLEHNPRAVQQAILNWAAATWPEDTPTNLKAVAERLDDPILKEIFRHLEQALYGSADGLQWDGAAAWQDLAAALKPQKNKALQSSRQKPEKLPPLYKNHNQA